MCDGRRDAIVSPQPHSLVRTLRPQVTPGPLAPGPGPFPLCCLLQKITERSKVLFLILRQSVSNKITFGYFLLHRKRGWVLKRFYGSCRRPRSSKRMTTEYLYKAKEDRALFRVCARCANNPTKTSANDLSRSGRKDTRGR